MGAHRTGKVWTAGTGWVAKKETRDADYDNIGEGWIFLLSFARWFPDFLADLMRSDDADFELSLIQRVILRANARNQYSDITGCRGLTKSYCSELGKMLEMLMWIGIKIAYFAPSYKQGAKICSQTYHQIEKDYPALCDHFTVESESADRFEISTAYRSNFSIAAFRGNNLHQVVAEEYAQEGNPRFDDEEYKRVVLPSVRLQYKVKGRVDPTYISFKQHTITSASRRQNHAYETRCRHYQMMSRGERAFVMDVPYDVVLLTLMRPREWAVSLQNELTPDEWAREMESRYTGADENPIVSDSALNDSRELVMMEEHHCCKDKDNTLKPDDVIYIVGYDVSYADGADNAKCACVVLKCTKQKELLKRDRYLKQVVWVDDWTPLNAAGQAQRLKQVWARFCYEGSQTFIAIDNWQYGTAVTQALMTDLEDGLSPLCIYEHEQYVAYELEDALPVIYPIRAGGVGARDNDSEMVRYAELQFEYRNVQLLISNYNQGIEAYKVAHRIRDDSYDGLIYRPYKKTNELVGQIQNLKKVPSGMGFSEKRISKHIQRDSWSALKYALRLAQILERKNLAKVEHKSDWDDAIAQFKQGVNAVAVASKSRLVTARRGGRIV